MLLMSGVNLLAEDHQQHIDLGWGEIPPIMDKHQDRSLQTGMEVFLDIPNLVFCSNMMEEQEANIHILNACGEKVMSETLRLSPLQRDTSLYRRLALRDVSIGDRTGRCRVKRNFSYI